MKSNQQQQLQWLNEIFRTANYSPIFRQHDGVPEGMIAYISFSDLLAFRYIIRILPVEKITQPILIEGNMIARYETVEALVADRWELD